MSDEINYLTVVCDGIKKLDHEARVRVAHWLVSYVDDETPGDVTPDEALRAAHRIITRGTQEILNSIRHRGQPPRYTASTRLLVRRKAPRCSICNKTGHNVRTHKKPAEWPNGIEV